MAAAIAIGFAAGLSPAVAETASKGKPAAAAKPAAATQKPAADAAAKAPAVPAEPPVVPIVTPAKKLFGAAAVASPLKPRAIGGYAKGCLAGGKALAVDGPAWQAMRLSRNRNWGHPKLIELLERFAMEMKTKENWPGLLIGDLAQPRGGPMLTGHKSHQLGLDADVWFKPMPDRIIPRAERETFEPLLLAEDRGKEVIAANWNEGFVRLVKRAASYPEVDRVFVHPAIKKAFCAAAGTDRAWLRKVRPIWLHNYHFHIRMSCPEGSTGCINQAPPPPDDGCGKEVDDWIALVSKQPARSVAPPKPAPPPKPVQEMTIAQLPADCRAVLTAGQPENSDVLKALQKADEEAKAAAKAEKALKAFKAKQAELAKARGKGAGGKAADIPVQPAAAPAAKPAAPDAAADPAKPPSPAAGAPAAPSPAAN